MITYDCMILYPVRALRAQRVPFQQQDDFIHYDDACKWCSERCGEFEEIDQEEYQQVEHCYCVVPRK